MVEVTRTKAWPGYLLLLAIILMIIILCSNLGKDFSGVKLIPPTYTIIGPH